LFVVLEVVLLFNLLIFVHELGHFLAARWRGLHVDRFAVWFGKPLWKKTIGGVEYVLGSIPAGGYVSLPQMAPMEIMEGKSSATREELPPVSAKDKIIVAFAGPVFSFLLAVVFAGIVAVIGRPVTEAETTTVIGYVDMALRSKDLPDKTRTQLEKARDEAKRIRTIVGRLDAVQDRTVDPYPNIENCPDLGVGYRIGGPGSIFDDTEQRLSARLSGTQRLKAVGSHEVKVGLDVEQNLMNKPRNFSGDDSIGPI